MKAPRTLPSIASRLGRGGGGRRALLWSLAVSAAVWLAVRYEIGELFDETLQGTAEELAPLLAAQAAPPTATGAGSGHAGAQGEGGVAWQVVMPQAGNGGHLLFGSLGAPRQPWWPTPTPGLRDTAGWRVHGMALGIDGRMLYVGQRLEERDEEALEAAFGAVLAALAMSVLAQLWLRAHVARELLPVQRLAERVAGHDLLASETTLGAAERAELRPVHEAIDMLAQQLRRRVDHERAFSAHAAHALRTPLAGIDAQLSVALREAPAALQPRLQRVRTAAGRLQRVVTAMLALFRSGSKLQLGRVALAALVDPLPVDAIALEVAPGNLDEVDADILGAALANLLDNALRHGATAMRITQPAPGVLRVADDGPGVTDERRRALQQALDTQRYDSGVGLGLMLADMVARAHGGALVLPLVAQGFAVDLHLTARTLPR